MPAIALRQYGYTPHLGWSSTRWETFRTCRRRYFGPPEKAERA